MKSQKKHMKPLPVAHKRITKTHLVLAFSSQKQALQSAGPSKMATSPSRTTTATIGSARKASSRATGGGTRPIAWQGVPTNPRRWNQAWHDAQNDEISSWNLDQISIHDIYAYVLICAYVTCEIHKFVIYSV